MEQSAQKKKQQQNRMHRREHKHLTRERKEQMFKHRNDFAIMQYRNGEQHQVEFVKWQMYAFYLINASGETMFPSDLFPVLWRNLLLDEYDNHYDRDIQRVILDDNLVLMQFLCQNYPSELTSFHQRYKCNIIDWILLTGDKKEMVKLIHENIPELIGTRHSLREAIIHEDIPFMMWLHVEMGIPFCNKVMDDVVHHGNFTLVKFLHEKKGLCGPRGVMHAAIQNGHFDIIKYLFYVVGVKADDRIMHFFGRVTLRNDFMRDAVEYGDLSIVKFLHRIARCSIIRADVKRAEELVNKDPNAPSNAKKNALADYHGILAYLKSEIYFQI